MQACGKLAVYTAMVLVCVIPADVSEGSLNAEVGLHELRDLHHLFAEGAAGVVCAWGGDILSGIHGFEHPDSLERVSGGAAEDGICGVGIHCLKASSNWNSGRVGAADRKGTYVLKRDSRDATLECKRQLRLNGHGAEGVLVAMTAARCDQVCWLRIRFVFRL